MTTYSTFDKAFPTSCYQRPIAVLKTDETFGLYVHPVDSREDILVLSVDSDCLSHFN